MTIEFVSEGVTVTGISTTRVTSWVTITVAHSVTGTVWKTGFSVDGGTETVQALPKKTVNVLMASHQTIFFKMMGVFMGLV